MNERVEMNNNGREVIAKKTFEYEDEIIFKNEVGLVTSNGKSVTVERSDDNCIKIIKIKLDEKLWELVP